MAHRVEIVIYESRGFAHCELPNGRPLFGRDISDICECLDAMSDAGVVLDGNEVYTRPDEHGIMFHGPQQP